MTTRVAVSPAKLPEEWLCARAQEITQRFKVDHVPFFIINGKYTTDVTMAGGEEQLMQLISDLAASEHH